MKISATLVILASLILSPLLKAEDLVIGESLGKLVYASQIKGTDGTERADSLRAAFISPAIGEYLKAHKSEIALTEKESDSLIASYNAVRACKPEIGLAELKPPFDKLFAQMIGGGAKAQRFIYLNHGRGRLLFQQAGVEAFDATRNLILDLEKKGKFKFNNQDDRSLALAYWTTQDHGSFLLPDPGTENALKLDTLLTKCPSS